MSVMEWISVYVCLVREEFVDSNAVQIVFGMVSKGISLKDKVHNRQTNVARKKMGFIDIKQITFVAGKFVIKFVLVGRKDFDVEPNEFVDAVKHRFDVPHYFAFAFERVIAYTETGGLAE